MTNLGKKSEVLREKNRPGGASGFTKQKGGGRRRCPENLLCLGENIENRERIFGRGGIAKKAGMA